MTRTPSRRAGTRPRSLAFALLRFAICQTAAPTIFGALVVSLSVLEAGSMKGREPPVRQVLPRRGAQCSVSSLCTPVERPAPAACSPDQQGATRNLASEETLPAAPRSATCRRCGSPVAKPKAAAPAFPVSTHSQPLRTGSFASPCRSRASLAGKMLSVWR